MTKEKDYNATKISKLIYFFFTLQNQGIPVNEIYERDGVKAIKTERFQEMVGGDGLAARDTNQDVELTFYSDDSFEYVPVSWRLVSRSKFRNTHKVAIPLLDFADLPSYETTEDDEEE